MSHPHSFARNEASVHEASAPEDAPQEGAFVPSHHRLVETLLGASNDAIVVLSPSRIVRVWSAGAEKMFGYAAAEMVGQSLDVLIPNGQSGELVKATEAILRGGEAQMYEAVRLNKAGRALHVEISLTPLRDTHGELVEILGITRDISARKHTEQALQVRLGQQAAVARLGQHALEETELAVLFDEAVALLQELLDVEFVKILELLPDLGHLRLSHGVGWAPGLVGNVVLGTNLESQAGYTLLQAAPVIVKDLRMETRFNGPPLLLEHGVVSGMSTAIRGGTQGRPFGVLGVHTARPRQFTQDDVHFLQAVANVLAAAIRQSHAAADRDARLRAETHLREVEADVHQRAVVMEVANRVALDILSNRIGYEALRNIAESARVLANARYAALGIANPNGQGLEQFITVGLTSDEEANIGAPPRGLGVLGLLLQQKEPLRIDNLSDHPASVGFPARHPNMTSFLGVPIRRGDAVIGSLYLTNKQGAKAFTEADVAAVSALGAHAAVAIHNLRMLSRQRDLTHSLLAAQEEERRAIAYDLHDGLVQYIMASHAHLEAFKRTFTQGNASQEKSLKQLEQGLGYLKESVVESRRMVNNLRLLVLDDLGLAGALEQLIQEEVVRAGWQDSHLEQNIGEERFETQLETVVYRVAQESLTNARRHAASPRIHLKLVRQATRGQAQLRLEVRDWGQGFVVEERIGAPGHVGLQGMIERVQLLGGNLEIRSAPEKGTFIGATFPLEKRLEHASKKTE